MKTSIFSILVLLVFLSSSNVVYAQFGQGLLCGVGLAAMNYNNQRQNSNRFSSDYYINKYRTDRTNSRNVELEVSKTRQVEDDGFVWYKLRNIGGMYGIENANGNVVLSPDYGPIYYDKDSKNFKVECKSGCHKGVLSKGGSWLIPLDREYESLYFSTHFDKYVVEKNDFKGICSTDGKEIIAPNKYSDIQLFDEIYYVEKDGYKGACDANGKEIIAPNKYKDVLFLSGEFKYKNNNGDWISMNIDKNGKLIVVSPPDMENSTTHDNMKRVYYDAIIYDLKGHVKTCKSYKKLFYEDVYIISESVEFSMTGQERISSEDINIKRNVDGQIAELCYKADLWGEPVIIYKKILFLNNKLSSVQTFYVFEGDNEKHAQSIDTYYYNSKGLLVKVINKDCSGDGRVDCITEYQYVSFDEKGNWTERKYEDPWTLNEVN